MSTVSSTYLQKSCDSRADEQLDGDDIHTWAGLLLLIIRYPHNMYVAEPAEEGRKTFRSSRRNENNESDTELSRGETSDKIVITG